MKTTLPRLFVTMGIAAVIGLALPVRKGAAASTGETGQHTEVVAKLTGPGPLNYTNEKWGVDGTDLGHMFRYGDQLRFTFGDTFGSRSGLADHRDNTMAWSTDTSLTDGLQFNDYVTDRPGHAKKLFDDPKVANVIPTYGIAVGQRMFLHYMAVAQWLTPGRWDVAYSGLAYSDDEGRTWTMDPKVKWGDHSNFAQVAFVRPGDGYIYLFGIPEGRFGGVKLARVPEGSLLDRGAYRYWAGLGWTRSEWLASTIVPAPVGELSVRWSGHYKRWLMTYLNDNNLPGEPERIVLRSAENLIGRWSDELLLTTSAEYPDPYAPYQVPDQPDGRDLYFTMSRFFPEYNVFLMRTTLPERLPGPATGIVLPLRSP